MPPVVRSYRVGLHFKGNKPREEEKKASQYVRGHQQIVQDKIIDNNLVDLAYDLLDTNPDFSGNMGAAHLAAKSGDRSNIGQVSSTYAIAAVNGAIDREHKLEYLFKLFEEHPKEAISWMVFLRTPFLESSLSKILDVKFDYTRNLVYSASKNMISAFADIIVPQLSENNLSKALDEVIIEVEQRIVEMKGEGKSVKKSQTFLNKLYFLRKNFDFLNMCLFHWLTYEISNPGNSRWKSLKKLSNEFSLMLGYKYRKYLFSAIRSVVVHALSFHLDETVKKLCETVSSRDLVAKPYKKQRKQLAPVNLIMGYKFVVIRPGNGEDMTRLALRDKKFSIGIRNPENGRLIINAEIRIHKRLYRMLERGAKITSLSIRSGDAPAHKILVNINLEGKKKAFITTRFLKNYENLGLKKDDIIGLDVNRLGPHILAFSQEFKLPKILLTLCERYRKLGGDISRLSAIISRNDTIKNRGELNRVYNRRKNILKSIKEECKLLSAAVLVQTNAKDFNVEDLNFSARGKRGALAKAILSMPDEIDIFRKSTELASIYTNKKVKLNTINPYKTSSQHYNCGGKLKREKGNWDICLCTKCDIEVNTHRNAALHIRDGGVMV